MVRKDTKKIIMDYFFDNPTSKLRVRQIEKKLNLSMPSVLRYSDELVKEKILKIEKISGVTFFSANRMSKKFLFEKQLYNLKKMNESDLIDYLKKELSNPLIIVFGSYSKGEDIEKSDIDLYIETPSKKKVDLKKFEKILKRDIQLFVFQSIKKINNVHLRNNIINGIVLNGFLEVFK